MRLRFVAMTSDYNPTLSWQFFTGHSDQLMASMSEFERILALAQFVPQIYWNAAPLDQIEAWVRAHVPPTTAQYIARGMQSAHFQADLKQRLVPEADAFVASGHS